MGQVFNAQATSETFNQTEFTFKKVDVGQMLGRSHVLKTVQDHQGFIWAATQDGLYRYDGYQLKAFRHDPDVKTSLPGNYILSLFVDSAGILWIATAQKGIASFDHETEKFTRYANQPDNPNSLSHNMVFAIDEGKDNEIWIATFGGGLNQLSKSSGIITRYQHDKQSPTAISDDKVTAIMHDDNANLWIGTYSQGISRFDKKSEQFIRVPFVSELGKGNHVLALFQDSKKRIWASTSREGLSYYNPLNNRFETLNATNKQKQPLAEHVLYDIAEDHMGNLWLASRYGGLLQLDPQTSHFINYRHQALNPDSLAGNNIFSLMVDRTGIVWLSMFNDGLSMFDPSTARFGKVMLPTEYGLNKAVFSAMWLTEDKQLWIGSDLGLSKRDLATGAIQHYRHDPEVKDSLSDSDIESVYQDTSGSIWAGSQKGGLNRLKPDGSGFEHFRHDPNRNNSLPHDSVLAIIEDKYNQLWVGTGAGLARFNRDTEQFKRFVHNESDNQSLSNNTIYTITSTQQGDLWIGTGSGGLNRFNRSSNNFTRYMHNPNDSNSLSNNRVFSIMQDKQGILWIGTAGGLNRLDQNENFSHFREKDGLINDAVFNIAQDAQNNLWLGLGEKSIALFNSQTYEIRNDLGQETHCFANQNALHKAKDGELFFGAKGYCAFKPQDVLRGSIAPKLALTEFYLLHQSLSPNPDPAVSKLAKALNHTQSIALDHLDNIISFEFAALHFAAPKRNQYRYRLLGFDQNWINTDAKNRRATYTNLPSGNYTFEVQGSNHEGVWAENTASVALLIAPAPWRTWWAYLLYLMTAMVIIGTIAQQRHLKRQALILAKNNAELAKQNAEKANMAKTLFVADISHEIRTPLNAVLGYTQMLEQDPTLSAFHKQKLGIIEKSGNHLLGLINNILDIAKIEADAMTLDNEYFELVDMLRALILMFTVRCEQQDITLSLDNQAGKVITVLADQNKLRQVLINLIGNAIKFTKSGKVTLTLSQRTPGNYYFSVKDTGMGIAPNNYEKIFTAFGQTDEGVKKGGTGLGLAIAYKQVSIMGGELKLESTLGQGSCFYFTVPLKNAPPPLHQQLRSTISAKLPKGISKTALVVDDNDESRELLAELLSRIGLQVHLCADAEQALTLLIKVPTDIAFIDIKMPGLDGTELLKMMKLRYGKDCPPLVGVSAHAMQQDIQRFVAMGFSDYITKPYRFDTIYQCLEVLLKIEFDTVDHSTINNTVIEDPDKFIIPSRYLSRLKTVASDYEVTLLEECLVELAEHSTMGTKLCERIRPYLNNYDMDGLLRLLEQVEGEDA